MGAIGHQPVHVHAFGDIFRGSSSIHIANTVIVTDGTIVTGEVTDTSFINQMYLQIQESNSWKADFSFINLIEPPQTIKIVGRYVGSSAHNVKVKAWNFTLAQWDDVSADAQDIPNTGSTDVIYDFTFPSISADYISSGESRVQIDHESNSVPTHNMYIDYIHITESSIEMPTAGTFVLIDSHENGESENVTLDGANGTITVKLPGIYRVGFHISFSGSTNRLFDMCVFTNDVQDTKIGASRSTTNLTDVGSLSSAGFVQLSTDDELDIRIKSDTDDSNVSIERYHFSVQRVS